jgi:uncharacterized membrane protein YdbT with pleckstrin-like domain
MGSYVNNHLGTGEALVYETKNHWIIFFSFWSLFTLFLAPIIAMITNEFALTNKRVIVKEGFISRRSLEIPISKVESVSVDQGILGRILGYGSLHIRGTGGTNEHFHNISRPLEFRRQFQELAHG